MSSAEKPAKPGAKEPAGIARTYILHQEDIDLLEACKKVMGAESASAVVRYAIRRLAGELGAGAGAGKKTP